MYGKAISNTCMHVGMELSLRQGQRTSGHNSKGKVTLPLPAGTDG